MTMTNQLSTLTVKDFLTLPMAKDFQLIAGHNGLDNIISGGNIMDNPNALDWFKAGEVLITSGYFLTNDPITQLEALKIFKEMNLAAIVIKALTFFERIPDSLIQYCNQLDIPLIEIPYGLTFSDIINDLMNELSPSQKSEKQIALDSHNRFFQASLNGGGIDVITYDLSSLMGNPTIVVDSDWNILSSKRIEDDEIDFFLASKGSLQFDLDSLDDLPLKAQEIKHIIHRKFHKDEITVNCSIMPIYFNTINYGYILVITTFKKLSHIDVVILESASMALALQISQKQELDRNNNRLVRDFFKQLLSGEKIDANLLKSVGITIDYNAYYSFVIFNTAIEYPDDISPFQRKQDEISIMKRLLEEVKRFNHDTNSELQIFKQADKLYGFFKKQPNKTKRESKLQEQAFFKQLLNYISVRMDSALNLQVMVGSAQSVSNLLTSYEEALRIESFDLQSSQNIFFFDEFYLELFLSDRIDESDEKLFYTHYLTPLIEYDANNNADLVNTLFHYLNNQFNIATTSRDLFIHRNTMLYRIDKIKEILDIDIQQPKNILALHLAFKFYEHKPVQDHLF